MYLTGFIEKGICTSSFLETLSIATCVVEIFAIMTILTDLRPCKRL